MDNIVNNLQELANLIRRRAIDNNVSIEEVLEELKAKYLEGVKK